MLAAAGIDDALPSTSDVLINNVNATEFDDDDVDLDPTDDANDDGEKLFDELVPVYIYIT